MKIEHPYNFETIEGYTLHISRLLHMMHYARQTTLYASRELSQEELDTRIHPEGNSVAMLLAHMAAVETYYQNLTFFGIEGNWDLPAERLGKTAQDIIKGEPLEHYVDNLNSARKKTLLEFAKRDDDWLQETTPWWDDEPGNNYFKWFHVFEDEINHRGQIALLKRYIKSGK